MSRNIRCSQCGEPIIKGTVLIHWLKLMHYFEHELLEGEITNDTYEAMTEALMTFKAWAYDMEEEDRKEWAKDEARDE